ncbi:hypothetical protein SpCBS45565_g07327 [Spizellomyces sp. 'palustris']|nr:hypothetical protein SpCBS45565_g07327 [Spizellomyces sp. 'palustris']
MASPQNIKSHPSPPASAEGAPQTIEDLQSYQSNSSKLPVTPGALQKNLRVRQNENLTVRVQGPAQTPTSLPPQSGPSPPRYSPGSNPLLNEQSPNTGAPGTAKPPEDEFDWFHVEADAQPEEEEKEYRAKGLFGLDCCYLPGWARFFVYLFSGIALFATPALVSLIIWNPGDPGVFDAVSAKSDLRISTEVARWSCWLGAAWISWVVLWYFIDALPYLIVVFLSKLFGGYSERARARLEYMVAVKLFLTITCWAILTVVAYALLFNQMQQVDYWETVFHVLVTGMVFAICLLVHKLVLQIIAVNFHRVAYRDRIVESKHHMRTLDNLKKSIKTRTFAEFFIPAELNTTKGRSQGVLEEDNTQDEGKDTLPAVNQSPRKRTRRSGFWKMVVSRRRTGSSTTEDDNSAMEMMETSDETSDVGLAKINTTFDVIGQHAEEEEVVKSSALASNELITAPQAYDLGQPPATLQQSGTMRRLSSSSVRNPTPRSAPRSPAMTPSKMLDPTDFGRHSRHSTRFPSLLRPMSRAPSVHQPIEQGVPESLHSPDTSNALNSIMNPPTFHGHKYIRELAKMDITSNIQAGKLAKKIFIGLGGNEKGYLTLDDFVCSFSSPTEAADAFSALDQDGNGSITRKEVKEVVIGMYRERRRLFRAMRDLSQALGKLNTFFYFVTSFVTFCIALPIFGISLTAMLPFTSFILALSFVFGTAARTAFESLLFLFLTHPYDAGDRVVIDNQNLLVEEVGVLTTVFKRLDGQLIYAPNTLVASKLIHNLRRSGDQSESIELQLNFDTPEEKLRALKERMVDFVKSEPREFQGVCDIHISDIENLNKLKVNVILKHKGNWQDGSRRWNRRTMACFMFALKKNLLELGIRYATPPQHKAPEPAAPVLTAGINFEQNQSLGVPQSFANGMNTAI